MLINLWFRKTGYWPLSEILYAFWLFTLIYPHQSGQASHGIKYIHLGEFSSISSTANTHAWIHVKQVV